MPEIYQTDSQFPTAIQEWGCFFLSTLKAMATLFDASIWNYGSIMTIYEQAEIDHVLLSDLTVKDAQGLCDAVAPSRVKYLDGASSAYPTASDQFEILVWHREGVDFNHFTLGGGGKMGGTAGVVFYDPYSAAGSLSVKEGQIIGKRIFHII